MDTGPCIYQIRNLQNNEIYIGSTSVGLNFRKAVHLTHLRSGTHHSIKLQSSFRKRGEASFSFELLELITDLPKILEREQHFIDTLHPKYNMSLVAGSGGPHSAETKEKLRQINLGRKHTEETKEKLRNKIYTPERIEKMRQAKLAKQHKHTPETKQKMSEAHKGKTKPQSHRDNLSISHGKIPEDEVIQILTWYYEGFVPIKEIMTLTGRTNPQIYDIIAFKTYTRISLVGERL